MALKNKISKTIPIILTTAATSTSGALIGSAMAGPIGTTVGIIVGTAVGLSTGIAGSKSSYISFGDLGDQEKNIK